MDELYMRRCLELARLGAGQVSPNPMVGALLVYQGRIIGEGYHEFFGGPHAEVHAIQNVQPEDRPFIADSTLYVSLEPCNHFGKTPPCTDLILHHQIKKVFIAIRDPFEKVDGKGIERLRQAGVEVHTGLLEKEAEELNCRFFTFHKQQRPYIILKWAQSADGSIAAEGNRPVRISNKITDRLVHRWRSEEDSILIGRQTGISDNPSLTTRLWPGKNPVRLVADSHLSISSGSRLYDGSARTIIFNTIKESPEGNPVFRQLKELTPATIVNQVYQAGLQSVLIEGGTRLLQSFIDSGLWDEARVITNRELRLPLGTPSPNLHSAIESRSEELGSDLIAYYRHSKTIRERHV